MRREQKSVRLETCRAATLIFMKSRIPLVLEIVMLLMLGENRSCIVVATVDQTAPGRPRRQSQEPKSRIAVKSPKRSTSDRGSVDWGEQIAARGDLFWVLSRLDFEGVFESGIGFGRWVLNDSRFQIRLKQKQERIEMGSCSSMVYRGRDRIK